jgi:hypothetical protein
MARPMPQLRNVALEPVGTYGHPFVIGRDPQHPAARLGAVKHVRDGAAFLGAGTEVLAVEIGGQGHRTTPRESNV